MTSVAITKQEKIAYPKLKLKTSMKELNEFVKKTHKEINKDKTEKRREKKAIKKSGLKAAENFKKAFAKAKEPRHKPVTQREDKDNCSLRELSRVVMFFEESQDKMVNQANIRQFTLLNNNKINQALKFLVRFKLVEEKNDKGIYFYTYKGVK